MKTKKIFALVSALTIAVMSVPTPAVFAKELDASANETVVEATADDTTTDDVVDPVVSELITEIEEEADADSTPTVEPEVVEEATSDEAVVEEDTNVLVEEEESEVEKEAEEGTHEHDIIYIPAGNHQHKVMCADGGDDCDFEEEIVDCVDENGDDICDFCNESTLDSGSSISIKVLAREYSYYNENGNFVVSDEYSPIFENSLTSSNGLLISDCMRTITEKEELPEKTEEMSEEEYEMEVSSTENRNKIREHIYNALQSLSLPEKCPEDLVITITMDDLCESVSNVESNYVKEDADDEKELEDTDSDEDTNDDEEDESIGNTDIEAKEDEILPEVVEGNNNPEDSVENTENTELESLDEASEEVATTDSQVADTQPDTDAQTETTDGE